MIAKEPNRSEGDVNRSALRTDWQTRALSKSTSDLLAQDAEVFLHQELSSPCLNALSGSEGSWLIDTEGRRYLDFHGNSAHQVGHGHPRVLAAIQEALQSLPFCPRRYTNHYAVELAQRLTARAPMQPAKLLLCPSGAGAVGIALKLARVATGRFKTVSMWDSFHGASLEAISLGGERQFREGLGPLLPGTEHVSPPDPTRCPLGCGRTCSLACASYLEYVLEREGDVAAVVAEPIRATTVAAAPPEYWQRVRRACDRHGALLIFDEIPTGLGRTGRYFASEWTGVAPDVVVLGKGLGGGIFPMAAVLARAELDVAAGSSLGHYTHEKSSVGCAASLAVLDLLEEENLIQRAEAVGSAMAVRLREFATHNPIIREVRQMGLLIGVELNEAHAAEAAMYHCLDRGLSFKVSSGTVLTLTPPLTITPEELELALDALEQALQLVSA